MQQLQARSRTLGASTSAPANSPRPSARPHRRLVVVRAAAGPDAAAAAAGSKRVRMRTLPTCKLAVSWYPIFSYNAAEGGGDGSVEDLGGGRSKLTFDPQALNIPALNYKTASIFGVPIPPPLNIAIVPQRFEGTLDRGTGVMELSFLAEFRFTAGEFELSCCLLLLFSVESS